MTRESKDEACSQAAGAALTIYGCNRLSNDQVGTVKRAGRKPTRMALRIMEDSAGAALKKETGRAEIALRAWQIWQSQGQPEGRALDHWVQAERELRGA